MAAILFWDAKDFGLESVSEVKAHYTCLEDALRQAEHDLRCGKTPLRIEVDGKVAWNTPTEAPPRYTPQEIADLRAHR